MDKVGKFFKTKFPNNFVVICTGVIQGGLCGGYTLHNQNPIPKCAICNHTVYEGIIVFGVGEPSNGIKLLSQGKFCLGSDEIFEEIEISSIKPEDFAETKPTVIILDATSDPSLKNDERKVLYTTSDGIRQECFLFTEKMARVLALGLAIINGLDEIHVTMAGRYIAEPATMEALYSLATKKEGEAPK